MQEEKSDKLDRQPVGLLLEVANSIIVANLHHSGSIIARTGKGGF